MTEDALRRITAALGGANVEGADERARRASFCVSADMAHAVHPNYADKHEPGHRPKFGAGVVIKHNANQRYATDAITGYLFRELENARGCACAGVRRAFRSSAREHHRTHPQHEHRHPNRRRGRAAALHAQRARDVLRRGRRARRHAFRAVYEGFSEMDQKLLVDGGIGHLCRTCE